MSQPTFYRQLPTLPLFIGLSGMELEEVAGNTKFAFSKITQNQIIVREGEQCSQLNYVLNGDIIIETHADNHHYTFLEKLSSPFLIQPEHLFGLHQHYTITVHAAGDCQLMSIDKQEVMRLSNNHLIFRLNLINLISAQAQKLSRHPWKPMAKEVSNRIIRFFEQHCIRPAGEKTIFTRMTDLAVEVADNRLNVSRALNQFEAEGLLTLSRGKIFIPQLEKLLNR